MTDDLKKSLTVAIEEIHQETEMARKIFHGFTEKFQELLQEIHNYPEIKFEVNAKEYRATLSFPIPEARVISNIHFASQSKVFHREDVVNIEASELLFALAGKTREESQTHYAFSFCSSAELIESYIKHLALAVNTINENRARNSHEKPA